MSATIASEKDLKAKADIRRMALMMAAFGWGSGIPFALMTRGRTFQEANSVAAAAAIAGLAAWTIYHLVSRQNNGIAILMGAFCQAMHSGPTRGFLPELGLLLAVNVPLAWLFGLMSRWYYSKAKKNDPAPTDAMYDAEIDRPGMPQRHSIPNEAV